MIKAFNYFLAVCVLLMLGACSIFGNGFNAPGPAYESYVSKQGYSKNKNIQGMLDCGFLSEYGEIPRVGDTGIIRLKLEECMFAKGFFYKSGWGGICSNPVIRGSTPACATAPLRSRDSYYGN